MRNFPIIRYICLRLRWCVRCVIGQAKLFCKSNTALNVLLIGASTFAQNLDSEYLKGHQWLPPFIAAFVAIAYKINQQIGEQKQNG